MTQLTQLALHVPSWHDRGWSCTCGLGQAASCLVVARTLALWHLRDVQEKAR